MDYYHITVQKLHQEVSLNANLFANKKKIERKKDSLQFMRQLVNWLVQWKGAMTPV